MKRPHFQINQDFEKIENQSENDDCRIEENERLIFDTTESDKNK